MRKMSRRRFLKKAVIAGAGISGFPAVFIPKSQAAWARQTVVHPNVDNLRVVAITDTEMTSAIKPGVDWASQDKLVMSKKVWENIDKLACGLEAAVKVNGPDNRLNRIGQKRVSLSAAAQFLALSEADIGCDTQILGYLGECGPAHHRGA